MKSSRLLLAGALVLLNVNACGSGGSGDGDVALPTLPQESLASFIDTCASLIENATVGLACLHCSQPQAHSQARVLAELMVSSCLRNIATNYLVDDTFEYSQNFLAEQIDTLAQGSRNVLITFFFSSGAAQRNFATTVIGGFGAQISPVDFRDRIQNDSDLRSEYSSIVRRARPIIERAISRGVTVIVVPQLEDNLSNDAFAAMRQLTQDALSGLPVVHGRNPCYNPDYPFIVAACEDGSELDIPEGVVPETHSAGPLVLISGGVITNDGIEYESPATGTVDSAQTTLNDLLNFRRAAQASGNTFILWSGLRQGLVGNFQAMAFELPEDRTYPIPSSEEREELLQFLQNTL